MNISFIELYKLLKTYDKQFYTQFDDEQIDNETYFQVAIKSELTSHMIGVVINLLEKNSCSPGLSTNLRAILEDITIFQIYKSGKLTDKNFTIFRLMYFLVESNNYRKQIKNSQQFLTQKDFFNQYRNEKLITVANLLNCNVRELKDYASGSDTPLFFLTNNIKNPIKMGELVTKELGNEIGLFYQNLGIQIHPYYCDSTFADLINVSRNKMIPILLNDALNIVCGSEPLLNYAEEQSLEYELTKNLSYSNHYRAIRHLKEMLNSTLMLIQQNMVLTSDYDHFVMKQLSSLWHDARMSLLLGFSEQAVAKFKSFVEIVSVYGRIRSCELTEHSTIIRGFEIATLMQFENIVNRVLKDNTSDSLDDELKNLYESYYKEKYKIDYDSFKSKTKQNSYYLLDNENKNYEKFVKDFAEHFFSEEPERSSFLSLYKVSKDFNHGGGYLFDSSDGLADNEAIKCVTFMQDYFVSLFQQCATYLKIESLDKTVDLLRVEYAFDQTRFLNKTIKPC